ncbi:30S ribosomal protein S12 methylthiotransferase accessory factor YcaO [Marinobacterium sp. YM272]|uniref:30S ribosomal protein S12 methylthiotransferase accessory factor YcaO n=1 Tax=Marinobacterium sp. YM272 TaxID=3421654 RepID=UPI003D7FF97D
MTLISGKDAPLNQSIVKMQDRLKSLGFELEELEWRNPVPHVWSVHLRDRNCPTLSTRGKGSSRDAALASALGEFFERAATNSFFSDYYLGEQIAHGEFVHYPNERWFEPAAGRWPDGLLDSVTRDHYDFHDELDPADLIDLNSSNWDRGICALPFVCQRSAETVWFPVNIISNLYASNGMAAGNNKWEARVQALSEIFERHIKSTIISTGISLPRIPGYVLRRYPEIIETLDLLKSRGLAVEIRDASLGGKFPLVNLTLINPDDGGCRAVFGAHPKFEVAMARAFTSALNGSESDQLVGFSEPTFNLDEVGTPENLEKHFFESAGKVAWDLLSIETDYPFTEWNIEGDSQAEFEALSQRIHRVDMDIYIADYEHLGLYACRIIVPGMSEVYPVDKLIKQNNNLAIEMRAPLLGINELDAEVYPELLDYLDAAGFDESLTVADLLGLVPDPDTIWEHLSVGELRLLLLLAVGRQEEAIDAIQEVLGADSVPAQRALLLRCVKAVLSITLDPVKELKNYRKLLTSIHGEPLFKRAVAMSRGAEIFEEFKTDSEQLGTFTRHSELLAAYQRLQSLKVDANSQG